MGFLPFWGLPWAIGEEHRPLRKLLLLRLPCPCSSGIPEIAKLLRWVSSTSSWKNHIIRETEGNNQAEIFISTQLGFLLIFFLPSLCFPFSVCLCPYFEAWIRQPRLHFCTSIARVLRKAEQRPEQLNVGTNHLGGSDESVCCALSFTMRQKGTVSTTTAAVFSVSAALPSRSPFVCSCLFFFLLWRNKRKQHLLWSI